MTTRRPVSSKGTKSAQKSPSLALARAVEEVISKETDKTWFKSFIKTWQLTLKLDSDPTRVVSNSNAIRAHSHSHPWLDLERRESIRECELNGIVLTNPINPHSAQWIGIHNVAHSKINSNVNSKLNWVEFGSVDSTLNWAHLWSLATVMGWRWASS